MLLFGIGLKQAPLPHSGAWEVCHPILFGFAIFSSGRNLDLVRGDHLNALECLPQAHQNVTSKLGLGLLPAEHIIQQLG